MSELTHFTVEDIALEMGDAPFGSNLKNIHYTDSGALVVQGKNVQGRSFDWNDKRHVSFEKHESIPRSHCYPGDLIFPKVGTIGKVGILSPCDGYDKYILSTNTMRLKVNPEKANPLFIYYYFTWSRTVNLIHAMNSKSVQPVFNFTTLKKFPLELPNLEVQNEAGRIIGELDNKIELNRQTNQTLEQIAQTIFKSWFVDFEPTHAKIAAKLNGQDPERAAMAAISGKSIEEIDQLSPDTQQQLRTTATLFPDNLVDSELGEIPEGWEVSQIGNEVGVVGGGTPSTKNPEFWEDGHHHWTTPKDMSNLTDKILLGTARKITDAGLAKISSGLLPVNTVLMSSRAPVGYLAIAKVLVAINQGYIAMKCEGMLTPEYVIQWAESVMDEIQQRASGTTFAEISKKNFKMIPVVIPSDVVVKEFSTIVSGLYEKITEALRETKSLTEIRDSLLPKLLSGEIE
jgi:type I restriction enzyme S subunit